MLKLRPQDLPKKYRADLRKCGGSNPDWQIFQVRSKKYIETRSVNERFSGTVFRAVHHLSSHAPKMVNRRWKQAGIRWDRKMVVRASARFANFFTVNRWL